MTLTGKACGPDGIIGKARTGRLWRCLVEQLPNGIGLPRVVMRQWLVVHGRRGFYRNGNLLPIKKLRFFKKLAEFSLTLGKPGMDIGGWVASVSAA